METFLNLVWLAITVAAVWLWRCRWIVSRKTPRHTPRMEAVALVCVLALLFPVISLTDDLHPETVAVDAASGKRNACLIAASAPHLRATTVSPVTHFAFGLISRSVPVTSLKSSEVIEPLNLIVFKYLAYTSSGRSPPILL